MKNLFFLFCIACFIQGQNLLKEDSNIINKELTIFLTKNILLQNNEKMISIYRKSGWNDVNQITHLIYKKNGKVIRIDEILSGGMNSKMNKIDTIYISKEQNKLYKTILKSKELNRLEKIQPENFNFKIDIEKGYCHIDDDETQGIIISNKDDKKHYRQYATRYYYSECSAINETGKNILHTFISVFNLFNINPI